MLSAQRLRGLTAREKLFERLFFLFEMSCSNNNNKNYMFKAQRARGRARLFFYFFYTFILLIELVEFNFVLTFLKDARERGAHDDCQWQSPLPTGPVSRSNRAAVRLCAPYVLTRTTSSTETPRSPSMLVPSQ